MVGTFGIIDETEETHAPEASARGICLAPSIEALEWLLKRVGFARVERLPTPPAATSSTVARQARDVRGRRRLADKIPFFPLRFP